MYIRGSENTEIYLVRHCETAANLEEKFQGMIDTDITDFGKKQLKALGVAFKNIRIDEIYTSPLTRTVKTAEAVRGKHKCKITPVYALHEIDGGVFEGMTFKEIYEKYPKVETAWFEAPQDYVSVGGESMRDLYTRSVKCIRDICKNNTHKSIVIVSHAVVLRAFTCYALGESVEKLKSVPWIPNTGITLINYNGKGYEPIYLGSVAHLRGLAVKTNDFMERK